MKSKEKLNQLKSRFLQRKTNARSKRIKNLFDKMNFFKGDGFMLF